MRRLALVIGLIAGAASVVIPLDVLTLPGVLLAALIWPQGIHTGGGAVPAEIAAQRRRSHIFMLIRWRRAHGPVPRLQGARGLISSG